jgi:hypothetical protein
MGPGCGDGAAAGETPGVGAGFGDGEAAKDPCWQQVVLLTGVASSLPGLGTQLLGHV